MNGMPYGRQLLWWVAIPLVAEAVISWIIRISGGGQPAWWLYMIGALVPVSLKIRHDVNMALLKWFDDDDGPFNLHG